MRRARSPNPQKEEGITIMPNVPSQEYLDRRIAELESAIEARDGARGVLIMQLIAADGYPEFAADLIRRLIAAGLANAGAR